MKDTRYRENRIRLRPDVNRSLDYYINEQRITIGDVAGVVITRNDLVSDIVQEFLRGKGHYPPRDKMED